MCRICGRVVKCIFDSMPSRVSSTARTRTFATAGRARPLERGSSHTPAQSLFKSTFSVETKAISKPPTVLLPIRASLSTATSTKQAATTSQPQDDTALPPSMLSNTQEITTSDTMSDLPMMPPSVSKPLVLSKSLQQLLPALSAQTPHYITAHIHRFPYLLQTGDTLRLPFNMSGVNPGDILRLNRASILGSRDFTLKAGTNSTETYDNKRTGEPNYLDERLFEVRARVMGTESGPMFEKEKTKRRNRKVKTVKSKHRYTVLKIMEVRVKSLSELMTEKGNVLLES